MMDLSIEAIEADLALAEVNIGRPLERLALARAQVRATLRGSSSSDQPTAALDREADESWWTRSAQGIDVHLVAPISEAEAVNAAARILGLETEYLLDRLYPVVEALVEPPVIEPPAEPVPDEVPDEDPGEIEIDDDDEDFFAEARKERKP